MKEIIGKSRNINDSLPRQLIINDIEIPSPPKVAEHFNKYFNVGPTLAAKIPQTKQHFKNYLT